jgi:four helix bundle protein
MATATRHDETLRTVSRARIQVRLRDCASLHEACQTSKPPVHLSRQVLKAGTSIGANLEEAKGAHSRGDKAAKFSIALKEARETTYWLRRFETEDGAANGPDRRTKG